jgi:hypothetical protein
MSLIHKPLWWFKNRFPSLAWKIRWVRPSRVRELLRFRGKSTQQIFEKIYHENRWGMSESRSGAGSTLRTTEYLRAELPRLVQRLGATSFLDAPCGDFNWMQHCELGVPYIGAEIVPQLVDELRAKYTRATPTPRTFIHLDITKDSFPDADLFFCRDCFLHLSFAHVQGALDNFRRSGARFLVASTYRDIRANIDNFTGGVRMLNLCLPPFNLPEPLEYLDDRGEAKFERCLGVWTREQLAAASSPK